MTQDTQGKELDGTWPNWVKENIERKCDAKELRDILLQNGFGIASIRKHMGNYFPSDTVVVEADYKAIATVRLTRANSGLNVQQLLSDKVQLYTLEGFMSEAECDRIVEIATNTLRPSTVTTGNKEYRTSATSDLSLLEDPDVKALDEKIATTLGVRLPYSEGIQAQRYDVGQEFKKHTDYFQPGTSEYATYAGRAGQRTWTFMVYLNNCTAGGGTQFFHLNKIFLPRKGMAVIWNNLYIDGSPNPSTLHAGMPVEAGHKIIITKWFRDQGSGPMFYD